jgi:transposase
MSLIQSAWLNGHDPYAYLKDVLTRLPTQRASEIGQLLPHQWVAAKTTQAPMLWDLQAWNN